jgi:cell division transport system permease protein
MSRLRLLGSEAWSSITANVATTFAAGMTVLIGMLLLGLFLALGTWVLSWGHHLKSQLEVKVYFADTTTTAERNATARILRADSRVKTIVYISKQQAYLQQKKQFPELYKNAPLPSNPLPASYVITPKKGEFSEPLYRDLRKATLPGVNDIRWPGKTGRRVLTIAKVISLVFLLAVVLLVGASTLLIANTIRLSIFARRREIEVMKLVGATNWFVRGPFMLEGLLCGLGGSIAAVILLLLGKELALPSILPHLNSDSDVHAVPFALNALALIAAGLLLGAAGSGLTMRRFLRV